MSNNNGLRAQYPYQGDTLSPRLPYDFPSPTSNYPSGVGAPSPGFFPMAYQISPRFGTSAFIPPPDVFLDTRRENGANGAYTPRELRKRNSDVLNSDPVAMHLLVETAMGDSQYFDILSVEEVESMKQEQKTLDSRLSTVRRKLESETKIRDAARSLTRLTLSRDKGHRRGLSSKGGNALKDTSSRSEEELEASNRKVEDLTRELLEIESRMRIIDMQLLMHTAAVLQLTHKGPKRKQSLGMSNGSVQRPDSPASMDTYDVNRGSKEKDPDLFDERSLYRSAENLDSLMNALQNGTFNQSTSLESRNQALTSMSQRLEELNERLRELIVQANPKQNQEYSLPPQASDGAVDAQLDFLDQGLRDISAEQTNLRENSRHSSSEVEGRLEVINNQLYTILSNASLDAQNETMPPPRITGGGAKEQLNYMEESFYNLEQAQYTLNQQIDQMRSTENALNKKLNEMRAKEDSLSEELTQMRSEGSIGPDAEKYETTLMGLWQIIISGEQEARERKRERRRMLANDPDADEELSPDEDCVDEEFSLTAFSAKVQWLYGRASTLKDKQSILMRQIKQQRELNSKSDAQKEAEFERLNESVLSARSEKKSMEEELERAMDQLRQFDEQKIQADSQALRAAEERNTGLEKALADVQGRLLDFQNELNDAQERSNRLEKQLKDAQDRNDVEARTVSTRSTENEAKVREARDRADALEAKLKEVEDDARVEAATIQAELAQAATKINEATAALKAATEEKEAAEARSLQATNSLNSKEEELRNLEGEVVRLTTELTFAKAELDGAYGSRAERAAESASNPAIKKELDELAAKNTALLGEVEALRKVQDIASQSEAEARESERNLKAELSGMAAEYEALTRDAIQNEKDRDVLEAQIEKLRDEKEALELELSDEKVKFLGIRSPSVANGAATPGQTDMGATSIRMLREDFRKMMRDRTAEGLKALRAEQEERRKLEAQLRQLRKDSSPQKSGLSKSLTAA